MGVKIFAIVDSDCNPDHVNQIIPGNDDAVRSIRLITARMATAILEGTAELEARLQAEREELELDAHTDAESAGLEAVDLGDQPLPPTLDGLEQEFLAAEVDGAESSDAAGEDGPVAASMLVESVVESAAEAPAPGAEAPPEHVAEVERSDAQSADPVEEPDVDVDDD